VALGALLIPVQIFMGDLHGLNTKEHQPAKVAAMEGQLGDRNARAAAPVRHPR
jgi:cytochrome bd-type quinol oxidase subunit 1